MAESTEPKFLIHQATHLFLTDPIHFQITQMSKSAFIWIGKADGQFGDLSVAVPPFGTTKHASATTITGKNVTDQSKNLARRLAAKYNQQFYITLSLTSPDDLLFVFVEKKLTEMLKNIM